MRPAAPPALAPQWLGSGWAGRGGVLAAAGLGARAPPAVRGLQPAASRGCGGRALRSPDPLAARAAEPGSATGRDGPPPASTARPPRCATASTWCCPPGPEPPAAVRLLPACSPLPSGRVGSARGARRAGPGARSAGGLRRRPGWGCLRDRPAVSSAFLRLGGCSGLCVPPPASRLLPVPVARPPTPLHPCRSLCFSGSLTRLYHSVTPRLSLCHSLSCLSLPLCQLYPCCSPLGRVLSLEAAALGGPHV